MQYTRYQPSLTVNWMKRASVVMNCVINFYVLNLLFNKRFSNSFELKSQCGALHSMIKFYYKDIENRPTDIDYLEVQSFEMNVYLVQISINHQIGMVYDNKDKPMRFYSAQHVREAFAHCQVQQAVMKHDTPYDEMIGNPPKADQSMALPFSMALPY